MISPILPSGPFFGSVANDAQPNGALQTQTVAAPPPPEPTNTDNRPGGNEAGRESALQQADRSKETQEGRGPRDDASPARTAVEGQMLSRDQEIMLSRAAADAVKEAAERRNDDVSNTQKAEAAFAQMREIERQQQEKAATLMRERM